MTSTTDFIAELIRAANRIEMLTDPEKRRLMDRGIRTIREMRVETGVRTSTSKTRDVLNSLEVACLKAETGTADEVKAVLLQIADMMRTLKIVLDAKNEILREGSDQ